ncbi:predicted protein [Plenodomus lingam JN3]|uniref:Predicted protein n=1 Tax=Leptosphaeria maculans (strain JN3 / isolate v23.1.3 / race Av1-4-5-6-7-8) TaxID=985895 RepID=E5A2G6_LEPMJ|nr:predicted protein [Plenodomus lingam JN3]CBX97601.1 predicted protein [Plenodomus lingam JN3]
MSSSLCPKTAVRSHFPHPIVPTSDISLAHVTEERLCKVPSAGKLHIEMDAWMG